MSMWSPSAATSLAAGGHHRGEKDIIAHQEKSPNCAPAHRRSHWPRWRRRLCTNCSGGGGDEAPPLKALIELAPDVKNEPARKRSGAGIPGITAGLAPWPLPVAVPAAQNIPSTVVSVRSDKLTPARLRRGCAVPVPVLVRVDENEILIDLRTVTESEFGFITDALKLVAS